MLFKGITRKSVQKKSYICNLQHTTFLFAYSVNRKIIVYLFLKVLAAV